MRAAPNQRVRYRSLQSCLARPWPVRCCHRRTGTPTCPARKRREREALLLASVWVGLVVYLSRIDAPALPGDDRLCELRRLIVGSAQRVPEFGAPALESTVFTDGHFLLHLRHGDRTPVIQLIPHSVAGHRRRRRQRQPPDDL